MMSLVDFFAPVSLETILPKKGFLNSQLGAKIHVYHNQFPDLENGDFNIAIIGVIEDRGSVNNEGCCLAPDHVREKLYQLHEGTFNSKIADLGNIIRGKKLSDTYFALKTVVAELLQQSIFPIIIGGSQDLTYPQYLAYQGIDKNVDLLTIDSYFDLEVDEDVFDKKMEANSNSFLNNIFLHEPNFLFNYCNVGYQTYLVSQESLRAMDKLLFDSKRLGEITGTIKNIEPTIRNASLLSFDITSIRSADAIGNANALPNGFYAEEACQICRYAGYSDKLTSIGFYEFNPAFDNNGQTAMLLAQMIWCFLDGFYHRKADLPMIQKADFIVYKTSLQDNAHELTFIKSKKTDRWWMQVPYPNVGSKNELFHFVPCLYEDYQIAISGEMPDIWWRTYQKLN